MTIKASPVSTFSDNLDKADIVPHLAVTLADYLRAKGISDVRILANTGITPQMLQQDDSLYSFRQMMQLIKNALVLSETPELGLIIGAQENISNWGLLGYAMMSCPTLGAALDICIKFQRAAPTALLISVHEEDDRDVLVATSPHPLGELLPFCVEEVFSSGIIIFSSILGERLTPIEVTLSYGAPGYADKYEVFFQCPVNFNQRRCSMSFQGGDNDQPLVHSDPMTAKLSEKLVSEFLLKHRETNSIVQDVRSRLLRVPGQFPSMEAVAQELGISTRTLRRNLQQQGVSFTDVYDGVRKDLAIEYLQASNLTAENIGQLLGFAELANFRRAFKRWTGVPPSSYRSKH